MSRLLARRCPDLPWRGQNLGRLRVRRRPCSRRLSPRRVWPPRPVRTGTSSSSDSCKSSFHPFREVSVVLLTIAMKCRRNMSSGSRDCPRCRASREWIAGVADGRCRIAPQPRRGRHDRTPQPERYARFPSFFQYGKMPVPPLPGRWHLPNPGCAGPGQPSQPLGLRAQKNTYSVTVTATGPRVKSPRA